MLSSLKCVTSPCGPRFACFVGDIMRARGQTLWTRDDRGAKRPGKPVNFAGELYSFVAHGRIYGILDYQIFLCSGTASGCPRCRTRHSRGNAHGRKSWPVAIPCSPEFLQARLETKSEKVSMGSRFVETSATPSPLQMVPANSGPILRMPRRMKANGSFV
jgi:hypothetical protein